MTRTQRRKHAHYLKLARKKRNEIIVKAKDIYGVVDLTAYNALMGYTSEDKVIIKQFQPFPYINKPLQKSKE